MNENAIATDRWSRILPDGYIGQQSFFTIKELVRRIPSRSDFASCLDLGCGRGQFAIFLAQRLPSLLVTGIEIDDESLNVARECAREHGISSRVVFEKGDFNDESLLSGGQWDGIISIDALQHASDLKEALLRVRNAWSGRGPLVISLWTFERRLASQKLAKAWGLECVYPMREIRAIARSLSLGLLVRLNRITFARRVERSLSSLIQHEVELRRLFGSRAYEDRLALEQATCVAVASGTASQIVMYAPSDCVRG